MYPMSTDFDDVIADAEFIAENFEGIERGALLDPTSGEEYLYTAVPTGCTNTVGDECSGYILCADLEEDGRGANDADRDTCDEFRTSNL